MVDNLPLSRQHSKGFGYVDYFTKNSHGKNVFQIMRVLALKGPMTKYAMSSLPRLTSKKETKFGWTQVHRYVTTLQNNDLVKQFGVQKIDDNRRAEGKKHEVPLYGLTPMGIVLTCFVDKNIYEHRGAVLTRYRKYEEGEQKGRSIWDEDKRKEVHGYDTKTLWGDTQMLLKILEFAKNAIPELPKIRAIFDPKNLDAIKLSTPSRDLRPFNHFFNTLSDEIVEIVQKGSESELARVVEHLDDCELSKPVFEWMKYRKNVLEFRLGLVKEAIHKLDQRLRKDEAQE